MPEGVVVHAPAKVNLYLRVLPGRWAGGYHTLETIFLAIGGSPPVRYLADEVEVESISGGIEFEVAGGSAPPGPENLAFRAATLFFEESGIAGGARIRLRKRIPLRAGLGGGSSDAAAVLLGLRSLFQVDWPDRRLESLAARLGSDVPFFIRGGLQRAEGVGDVLERLDFPKRRFWIVVARGRRELSTAAVYKAFDAFPPEEPPLTLAEAADRAQEGDWEAVLYNSLEAPARYLCPEVGEVADRLREHGARAVLMSGSGSAVFALERSLEAAEALAEAMRPHVPFVRVCQPLPGPIMPMTNDG